MMNIIVMILPLFLLLITVVITLVYVMVFRKNRRVFIRNKISVIDDLTQYNYNQLAEKLGGATNIQNTPTGMFCTWQEQEPNGTYTVTLSFDATGQCLGILNSYYI